MNFEAEQKKIESLSRSNLTAYEKDLDLMLTDAKAKVQKAKMTNEENNKIVSTAGAIDRRTLEIIFAMENEKKFLNLKKALNKRKRELMSPAERSQAAARKAKLLNRLQALQL